MRIYKRDLGDGVWTLLRDEPDFTSLEFAQRFAGTFSADGKTIKGKWETSHDGGATWELDVNLVYNRLT